MEEYLRNHLGQTKTPLAYIVRKEEAVPPNATDPSANYSIAQDELIARAPHRDAAGNHTELFNKDNYRVWTLLVELTRNHLCWTYIKGFARAWDGWAAFLKLCEHYSGINNVNKMASKAEKTIAKLVYTKEGKRWNFEAYVSGYKEQHQILEQLEMDYGYKCMDEGAKVRHLIAGIQTDKLNTIKGQILMTSTLQRDFDGCINLFKAFLQQVANDRGQTFNVSHVSTDDGNRKGAKAHENGRQAGRPQKPNHKRKTEDDGNDEEVKDRYDTPKEYAKLSTGQRKKLMKLRSGRQERQAAATLTDIQKLTIAVANLNKSQEGKDNKGEVAKDDEAGSNHSNPALQRKKTSNKD
jgi:hypothetical protein